MWDGVYSRVKETSFVRPHWIEPNWENPELVSVVVTCHGNYGQYLVRCLETVFKQSYPNMEVLVIDDNTTNLPELSNKVKHYKVDFNNANKTRNYGFSKSKGKYVLFLDADDWLVVNVISKFVHYMEKEEVSVVGGWFQTVNSDHTKRPVGLSNFPFSFDRERLLHWNYLQTSSLIRRKDFIGFDETINQFQDWDMWVRMLNKGKKFFYLPEVCLYYGIHGDNEQTKNLTNEQYKNKYRQLVRKNMTLTIATAFSGKTWCFDKYFKRLSELTFLKNRIRLVFFDDSNEPKFSKMLKKKIKKIRSKYLSVALMSGGVLPVSYGIHPVPHHMAIIYNRMRPAMIQGSHCFVWEDDVYPPKNIIESLVKYIWKDTGIISGYVKSRQFKKPLAWYYDNGLVQAYPNGKSLEEVGATGLGCALIPSFLLKSISFAGIKGNLAGHDIVFSRDVVDLDYRVLVNWKAPCLHRDKRGIVTPKIKLNLGSGYDYKVDYVNIDNEVGVPVDENLDLTKELPYPDESVDLIETHHLIEHLDVPRMDYMKEFAKIFKDWHRVLNGDGKIIIECPDFDGLVKLYNKKPKDGLLKHFYGMGSRKGHHHYIGWNYDRLKRVLSKAGFRLIKKKKARDYHAKQSPCLRVEAVK